jgi:hypothetical protein
MAQYTITESELDSLLTSSSMTQDKKQIVKELESIRRQSGGDLYPEAVVIFAENENTALHPKFEWDNNKAGHAHRLWQARQLIKIIPIYIESVKQEVSFYTSLKSDREEDGGYMATLEILSDENLRRQLLCDALRDFDYWKNKYITIKELMSVFKARNKIKVKR